MRLLSIVAMSVALVGMAGLALGQAADPRAAIPAVQESDLPIAPFVTFRNHGYLRFRADSFGQAHIHDTAREGTLTSGVIPPLGQNNLNLGAVGSDANRDYIGGANMRLRWEPSILVDDVFAVHSQIDVFDNLVLGSTPNWTVSDPSAPLGFWADGQAPPSTGNNSVIDSIRVKRAWLSWNVFHFLQVDLGRMPFHWGAGILQNDGNCLDCDHGDSVDRMGFTVGPFDFDAAGIENVYVGFAWDFPGEGAIVGSRFDYPTTTGGSVLGAGPAGFFGQPRDATQIDDVGQYVVTVESRAKSQAAQSERMRRLEQERVAVVEWGWLNVFRTQDYAYDLPESVGEQGICGSVAPSTALTDPRLDVPFDCPRFYNRDAFTWTTDFWLRLDWWPDVDERFTFEVEMAGVLFGSLGQTGIERNDDTSKDVWGGGAIVRSTYGLRDLTLGLEVGVASGDPDASYFGVRDGSNSVVSTNAATTDVGRAIRADHTYTQFRFNRDHLVDLILFREVIGAVTNTIYVKPTVQYDFLDLAGFTVGGKLSAMYAVAMFAEGTPGGGRHLGVETDAQIYVKANPHFAAFLEGGLLVPLDAFDVPVLPDPDLAWTVQLRLNLLF